MKEDEKEVLKTKLCVYCKRNIILCDCNKKECVED